MAKEKKKNWFRRHWILTTIIVLIILIIIGNISNSNNTATPSSSSSTIQPKTSGYTLDDCYSACDKYCMQSQTDFCQGNCQMIGKEGKDLDHYANLVKDRTANLSC